MVHESPGPPDWPSAGDAWATDDWSGAPTQSKPTPESSTAGGDPRRRRWRHLLLGWAAITLAIAFALGWMTSDLIADEGPAGADRLTDSTLSGESKRRPAAAGAGPIVSPSPTQPASPIATEAIPDQATAVPVSAVAATVIAIRDGDTLETSLGVVRVYGVDTPEIGTPLADEATMHLTSLAPVGASVYLNRSTGSDDVDRYGRLVRTVYTADGRDVARSLVEAGLAEAYLKYSDAYVQEEIEARSAGVGLWAPERALAPSGSSTGLATSPELDPWNHPGPDLDCTDIGHPVAITGEDYHRLDRDGDGIGCDSL